MSLKLNTVADDVVIQNISYQEGRLAKLLGEPPGSKVRSNPIRYAKAIGNTSFELGTDYYQQQRDSQLVKEKLALAAQHLLDAIALRQPNPAEAWQPTEYEKALGLAVSFGSPQLIDKAIAITPEQIFSGPSEQNRQLYRASAEYLELLKEFIRSGNLDQARLESVSKPTGSDKAWKFDKVQTAAKLTALEAVAHKDAAAWNQALATLIKDHENEVLRGDLQRLNDANIDIPALLLAKLGQNVGMQSTVQSPYLPLSLIS